MATYPTWASITADMAAGLSEAEAVQKAVRELRDAINDDAVAWLLARYRDLEVSEPDTPPE